MNGAVIPKGSGGAWRTAADGRLQGDGRLYVDGDAPWFSPMLFDPATQAPVAGQDGANIGPLHAPLHVVANQSGNGWRYENVVDWSAGGYPQPTSGTGYTPQAPYNPLAQSDLAARYFAAKQALLSFGQALGLE